MELCILNLRGVLFLRELCFFGGFVNETRTARWNGDWKVWRSCVCVYGLVLRLRAGNVENRWTCVCICIRYKGITNFITAGRTIVQNVFWEMIYMDMAILTCVYSICLKDSEVIDRTLLAMREDTCIELAGFLLYTCTYICIIHLP